MTVVMERKVGTASRGLRCPVIRESGDLPQIVVAACGKARGGRAFRRLTDLLGSLRDLTSGSSDKGTPVMLIQGHFDNFSN